MRIARELGRAIAGLPANPRTTSPPSSGKRSSNSKSSGASSLPSTSSVRFSGSSVAARSSKRRPFDRISKATCGCESAIASIVSVTRAVSALSARRNLRRAGTLKKSVRTSTTVPGRAGAGRTGRIAPPSTSISAPTSTPRRQDESLNRDTLAIDASASPRNPKVEIAARSSEVATLLVACAAIASGNSSGEIPLPSSETRTSSAPPPSTSTTMRRAPASSAFSTSSFTTLAGRSTTSPAAI